MTVGLGDIGKLWLSTKNPDPQSISNNFYGQRGMPTTNAALNVPVPCLVGQTVTVGHTAQYLPQAMSSTGMITIAFVDANGITMAIAVDQAYVNTMYQISNSHQMKRAGGLGVGSYY